MKKIKLDKEYAVSNDENDLLNNNNLILIILIFSKEEEGYILTLTLIQLTLFLCLLILPRLN